MIIFRDAFSDDEMLTDTYKMKLVNDVVWEVQGKTVSENLDIDDALIGGNASAEGGGEEVDPSMKTGIDVVLANRLVETGFSKKEYQKHIREYMKRVLGKIAGTEREAIFKKNIETFIKGVVKEIDEYQFFIGEKMDENGMVVLMRYPEGSTSPSLYFFKDGLIEEKA